jgi:hypothetical protein
VNRVNWPVAAVLIMILLLVLGAGLLVFKGFPADNGGWIIGYPGMTLGMFLLWLAGLGILGLVIAGVIWLVQWLTEKSEPPPEGKRCYSCRREVEPEWKNCPYCGVELP